MYTAKVIVALVFMGCVAVSHQRCYDYHCPHHGTLKECMQGRWTCQHGEYCEVTTHIAHGNSPWIVMNCRPLHTAEDCNAIQASNHPECDINKHDRICHWCCDTEECLRNLADGVTTTKTPPTTAPPAATTAPPAATTAPPAATTAPPAATAAPPAATTAPPAATTAPPAATTAPPAATTAPPAATTAPPVATTQASGQVCADVYLGDCVADFGSRCSEMLVQQLCAKTCQVC